MSSWNLTTSPRAARGSPAPRRGRCAAARRWPRTRRGAGRPDDLQTAELDGHRHGRGRLAEEDVAHQAVAVAVGLDRARSERHGRAALDVEEVGVSSRGRRGRCWRCRWTRGRWSPRCWCRRARRPMTTSASKRGEAAPHLRDAEVPDREADRRVGRVDRPAAGGQGEGGGGCGGHGPIVRLHPGGQETGSILVSAGPG